MSKNWSFFPCTIGSSPGSIMVDVGIGETIAKVPGTLAKLVLTYKNPSPNGMPPQAEYQDFRALETMLDNFVDAQGDAFVGRSSSGNECHFYIYTNTKPAVWRALAATLSEMSGYDLQCTISKDSRHKGYWDDLYPTADDFCVMSDMAVLEKLREEGDLPARARQFDHWVYFRSERAAQPFIKWLGTDNRFVLDAVTTARGKRGQFELRVLHQGTSHLRDVSDHTLTLARKADEFKGDYDGWETSVVRAKKARKKPAAKKSTKQRAKAARPK